jgi:hypothetical protein
MKTRFALVAALAAVAALSVAGVAAAAPPANTTPPTITGTPRVGETLTAQNGIWTNSPTAYEYQWQRCGGAGGSCVNVAGAVEKTYLLTSADAGRTMRVRVLAVNADGATARSAPTAVAAVGTAPQNTARPAIVGDPRVGEELTVEEGTWTNSPTGYSYQWQRCDVAGSNCLPVVGASGKTYGVRSADLGFRLRALVTARHAGGAGSATSELTGVVVPTATITNRRPTLAIISVRFLGNRATRASGSATTSAAT